MTLFIFPLTKAAISAYRTPSVEFIKSELPAPNAASCKRVTPFTSPFVGMYEVA